MIVHKPQKRGFTLIETLLAVLILAFAITGPLMLASRSLVAATSAKNQVTAYYLAQDAIEYVRFARDTNKLKSLNWMQGGGSGVVLESVCSATNCYVDSTGHAPAAAPTACPGVSPGVCPVINYDTTNNRFTYSAVSATVISTVYTRTIRITPVNNNANERTITATVSWKNNGGISKSVVIQENIYDWQ